MKCKRPLGLLVIWLSLCYCLPSDVTTARSSPIGETIKRLTDQLMDVNATSDGIMTFDTRTPPKIKQQQKQKIKKEPMENSHAGVAIPVEPEEIELEETTKKMNFYKIERPTTNSGLSTWILLSGQSSTTKPPTKKPIIKPTEPTTQNNNLTVVVTEMPPRIVKPIFKKRTTTRRPTSTVTTTTTATMKTTTASTKNMTETLIKTTTTKPTTTTTANKKLTKVKASILNSAISKKNVTVTMDVQKKQPVFNATEMIPVKINKTTDLAIKKNSTDTNLKEIESNALPAEAKEGETDLSSDTKKKTNSKRKKNKTRRRKPSDKLSNSTKIAKHKNKEKPISSQLYSYLSREVMPTVGMGMVGLLVTAGLASYFLYPFGAARRSYEVDRRDKEGAYYYNDHYSGGIAEEEAIGKVIAGMPTNALYGNTYKAPTSRHTYPNIKYRNVDRRSQVQTNAILDKIQQVQQTTKPPQHYENSYVIPPNYKSDSYQPVTYNLNENQDKYDDSKFVVGNIPKDLEEVTPVTVPEHGPRNLKIRRKRSNENEIDNEISSNFADKQTTISEETTLQADSSTTSTTTETSPTNQNTTEVIPNRLSSFIDLLKDVLHLKVHLGLQLVKNATNTVSNYVTRLQSRLDEHYRNYTESRHKYKGQ